MSVPAFISVPKIATFSTLNILSAFVIYVRHHYALRRPFIMTQVSVINCYDTIKSVKN